MGKNKGKICHWEILSTDIEASTKFYSALFGWAAQQFTGEYVILSVEDGVGGAIKKVDEMPGTGIEVYVEVEDIPSTLKRAADLGGTVKDGKTLISEQLGYWAAFEDPCGCRICL